MPNSQAYLKAGIMGFAGSGKTYTATELATGLVLHGRALGHEWAARPIHFFDTETGSDWVKPRCEKLGIKLLIAKTRSFQDLLDGVRETELSGSLLLIDSVTHIWREFVSAYQRKRNRSRLEFQDWGALKEQWADFTDAFINSQAHIVLCGRAGYEYDHIEDDKGKKHIEKTGVKMKAEGEMGYEPNLLIFMEREVKIDPKNPTDLTNVIRVASILKDRSATIDGKQFENPTFEVFRPHIDFLNLGGIHVGVDTSRTSDDMFPEDGEDRWYREKQMREVCLEEIEAELVRRWPGSTANEKQAKAEMVEALFGTRSWKAVEGLKLERLRAGRNLLWIKIRGYGYGSQQHKAANADAAAALAQEPEPQAPAQETGAPDAGAPAPADAVPADAVDGAPHASQ